MANVQKSKRPNLISRRQAISRVSKLLCDKGVDRTDVINALNDIPGVDVVPSDIVESLLKSAKNGRIYTVQDFLEHVRQGYLTDYDGDGVGFSFKDGLSKSTISMDTDDLKKLTRKYDFVIWYNR